MEENGGNLILVDGHQNLAYNVLAFGRDLSRSALETRGEEKRGPVPGIAGSCMVGLPELLAGNVAVVFGAVHTIPWHRGLSSLDVAYTDVQEAHRQGLAQLDVYRRWADDEPQVALIEDQAGLDAVLATWQTEPSQESPADRQIGVLTLMENAEPIREPAELELWRERGVRIVGLAWASNRYSAGSDEPGPLTDLGRELLEAMADQRMGLDLSHMAEQAALEALDRFEGVLMATHSNPSGVVPGPRQLSDALIRGIAERDGVIGIMPVNGFLRRDWRPGDRKERVTLTDVVRAIDYVCQRVGDAYHVALGSNFDGGFGSESTPLEIDTVADLGKIGGALAERGYEPDHVQAVLGTNWLRLLRQLLPE
jgi:membrane dipeptidase